ncbi:MAG: GNAT family N-acetyltransferase [Alphaproteobacteria bacterium]|nr:MAG: GNAT family N-acetyltransferase [Alphaproteobacteria bacterium]
MQSLRYRYDGERGWDLKWMISSITVERQLIDHPPIVVRSLSACEWQLKRDLRLAALQDSPWAFASSYDLEIHRSEDERRAWPRDGVYFAAFHERQAVGIAGSWMRAGEPQVTHLISMWVAPDVRGAGIARLLTEAVVGWAREREATRLELEVAAGNDAAMCAYLRAGFVVTKRTPSTSCRTVLELAL